MKQIRDLVADSDTETRPQAGRRHNKTPRREQSTSDKLEDSTSGLCGTGPADMVLTEASGCLPWNAKRRDRA